MAGCFEFCCIVIIIIFYRKKNIRPKLNLSSCTATSNITIVMVSVKVTSEISRNFELLNKVLVLIIIYIVRDSFIALIKNLRV